MLPQSKTRSADRPVLAPAEHRAWRALISRRCGLEFGDTRVRYLERRLWQRAQSLGLGSFGAYHDRLRQDSGEWRELLDYAGEALDRDLWRLALVDGAVAGVVLPVVWPGDDRTGTLFYVGIVPSHRGRGLGRALHAEGLRLLAAAGAVSYSGSTDCRNEAMARVFERNGCEILGRQLFLVPAGRAPGAPRVPSP